MNKLTQYRRRKAFSRSIWTRLLGLVVLPFVFASTIRAAGDDIKDSDISIEDHLTSGYITVKIPFYHDGGPDEWVRPEGSFISVEVDGTLHNCIQVSAKEQGEDPWYWVNLQLLKGHAALANNTRNNGGWRTISSSGFTRIETNKSGSLSSVEIQYYIPPEWLGKQLRVVVRLNIDGNSGEGDYSVNGSKTFSANQNYTAPTVNAVLSSANAGYYTVTGTISALTGSTNRYYGNGSIANTEFSGNTFSYDVPIQSTDRTITTSVKYKVNEVNKAEQAITKTSVTTIKGYPLPTNLTAVDAGGGAVELNWRMDVTGNQSDYFEIQRADNAGFNNAITLTSNLAISTGVNKSYIDDVSELNLNGTYYYRVRRTNNNWQWASNVHTSASVNIAMKHKTVEKASISLKGSKATIEWALADSTTGIWSKNSKVYINRINISAGGSKELIEVSADSLSASKNTGRYTDDLFIMCNKYRYEVYIQPGSTAYSKADPVSTDPVTPTEMGALKTFKASPGYFSERVELEWTSDGNTINEFIILRREHDTGNNFKQIGKVEGSAASSYYKYDDFNGLPGIIYDYEIQGMVRCADDILYSAPLEAIGFRTPTGDIYGRLTFENGQAVENVEVNVTSETGIPGRSLRFDTGQTAYIVDTGLLANNTDSVSIQAWISPENTTGKNKIVSKEGMYEIGIEDDLFYFRAGTQTLKTDTLTVSRLKASANFMHVTGVFKKGNLKIYINGKLTAEKQTDVTVPSNSSQVSLGGDNYKGIIDEVRIWSIPLSAESIRRDYNRYLTGGETGLIAYWNFNFATATDFYDVSYKSSVYNEKHGKIGTAALSATAGDQPAPEQLGFRGVTLADGSYSVRAVPYVGNGTPYQIVPKMGIHTFEPTMEVRNIGVGAQSHTVNFIDKSSFRVSGYVLYADSDIPVKGVNFTIDGKLAQESNGMPKSTDASGKFEIFVPVGTHEVKATMANHTFLNEGRITNQYGQDLNYQDAMSGFILEDLTKLKYIGRVAGGAIQEAYPVGHSLSKNNLAEGMTVTLTYTNPAYKFGKFENEENRYEWGGAIEVTEQHFKPSNKDKAHVNKVRYGDTDAANSHTITIFANDTTGEFVAYVIPEQFSVSVKAQGHPDIPGGTLDFSQKFAKQQEQYEYTDSIPNGNNGVIKTDYVDVVEFNHKQKFIKRYTPEIRVTQVNNRNQPLPYFGVDSLFTQNMIGEIDSVALYTSAGYTFNKPVFIQYVPYKLKMEAFERYDLYDKNGVKTGVTDEVPTQDATFKFNNEIADNEGKMADVTADEKGVAYYTFKAGDPELTTAVSKIALQMSYGGDANPTTIAWQYPDNFHNGEGFVLGAYQTGVDFVTAGPDKVLTILRDPPGSNSYSYLEKGVSFEESSTYTGSVKNTGNEDFTLGVKTDVVVFTGLGAGKIEKVMETESGVTWGVVHEEEYQGQDTKKRTTTTTTRFETSGDPLYTGADGDLYIGYSTNLTFGKTLHVTVIDKDKYDAAPGNYVHYGNSADGEWAMVQSEGLGANQVFSTMFVYPQVHIEQRLIPELEAGRNALLIRPGEYTEAELESTAIAKDTVFYLSLFPEDSEHFGKSNDDATIKHLIADPNSHDMFDGPSYKIIYNRSDPNISISDTVVAINQSISNWVKHMAANEKQKKEAELLQNYSFHAGSQIEFSESYSTAKAHESSFYIMIGGKVSNDMYLEATASKTKFEFTEQLETQHGGTFTNEEEASHSKGFVLADSGDDDYISVDVMREKGWNKESEDYGEGSDEGEGDLKEKKSYSTFIFRTKGGATSCPYEGAYVSKYYEPGKHVLSEATMQIEVPEIDMPVKFIENVPSGENAQLQLYLRNNSEIREDAWFDLKVLDASNPDGAQFKIDGGAIGNGRAFLVPAGETLIKTLEIGKGRVMNYDNLQLILQSQCQYDPTDFLEDIADTVTFSVHFIPSCTDVHIKKPGNNWTYNTRLPQVVVDGLEQHYMDMVLDGFNVNYDNFNSIRLQYKSASQSDDEWITLMNYYNDSTLYRTAVDNGMNAEMIKASDAGTINYRFFMDALSDQRYDLRAVSVCTVNNAEVYNVSGVVSGIKDMYRPRLFGAPQPADGILSVEDEVRLNFNEPVAEGLLSVGNFQVRGIRNGSVTDKSVSVRLDGKDDYMATEFEKSLEGKDITVEMWIQPDAAQDATLISHGNINESLELAFTSDKRLKVKVGNNEPILSEPVNYDQGSWAHVAFSYVSGGILTAYYNYDAVIIKDLSGGAYTGTGNFVLGKSITQDNDFYAGKILNVRVWEKIVNATSLQLQSEVQLSGNEAGLVAYYPMSEGKGTVCEDKARGAGLIMHGGEWVMPDGYAITTNGTNYLEIEAGTYGFTKEMDFTIEFWFKGEPGQKNVTMLSNGKGDGTDPGGSDYIFSIGYNGEGTLVFTNKGVTNEIEGDFLDNDWHHFALSVDRTIGRAQVYMDGNLTKYIDAAAVGGISSQYLYLGARGWIPETNLTTVNIDNYFKGSFDDLRFWNLYRSESVISENNNVKLNGEELGLIHYYPFDTYVIVNNVKFLEFSNKDMRNAGSLNPETDKFTVKGSTEELAKSKDIAPLKDVGPIASLEFDFVVNKDALIINLLEPEDKIAKTIVSFTVSDVRDVNGNSLASPITWSAYIDRNQLKWSEDRLNISKEVYEPLSFTVRALNTGGSISRYRIDNLPSWLEASNTSGTLSPSSYDEIEFTINEGLNVGTYNEVIYLTNKDNNVSEALTINLKVNGEKPDWTVKPSEFKYNMNVFGKMRFNNIFSADEGDMLAAFQDSKCVGVTTSTYNKPFDMWYALLTIYSNTIQHDKLEFRMWDASTGKIYKAIPDTKISFANDAVVGTVDNPIVFDGKEILFQNIALTEGWNWISFNLADERLSDVNSTLSHGKWTASDIVKSRDHFDSFSSSKGWMGTLSQTGGGFNNTSMFMLLSSAEQVLSISGTNVNTKATPIAVKGKQWNYIGYLPPVNTTVKEALAGYAAQTGDIVKSQSSFAMYSRNEWVGNLNYMEANRGYMLYRTADNEVSFVYPSVSAALSNKLRSAFDAPVTEAYVNTNFSENMSVIATTEGLQANDRILTYINGELRGIGTGKEVENQVMNFISISGNEAGTGIRFDLERNGEVIGTSNTPVRYSANDVLGTVSKPLYLDFGVLKQQVALYPSPFKTKLFVELTANEGSEAEISVFDVVGRLVFKTDKQDLSGNIYRVEIDGSSWESGIYAVLVTVDGVSTTHKVEKE